MKIKTSLCQLRIKKMSILIGKSEQKLLSFVLFIYPLSIMLNMSYFVFDTYDVFWLRIAVRCLKYVSLLLVVLYFFSCRGLIVISKNRMISFVLIIIAIMSCHFLPTKKYYVGIYDFMLVLDAFILLFVFSDEEVAKIFRNLVYIFLIISTPSIIYYVLSRMVDITLPFQILEPSLEGKRYNGDYYELRPLGLIYCNKYSSLARACGMFDEPGVLGTFAGLLLGVNYQKKPSLNFVNLLLLVNGLLSFSLAFYILFAMLFLVEAGKKSILWFVIIIGVIFISFYAFINMNFENAELNKLQRRFNTTNNAETIIVNNRYSSDYGEAFEDFIDAGGYASLFGNGHTSKNDNPKMYGSSIYKDIIYDYGIIGSFLYLLPFIMLIFCFGINKNNIAFILMFFASIYQRPYILNRQYIVIYISALCFLSLCKEREKSIKRNYLSLEV